MTQIIVHPNYCGCLQAFSYLIPEELFKMELEEGVERVHITISVLRNFKQLFHTHRQQIPKYYRPSQTIKLWDFPATLVFQHSDRIMERLLMIQVHGLTSVVLCVLVLYTVIPKKKMLEQFASRRHYFLVLITRSVTFQHIFYTKETAVYQF